MPITARDKTTVGGRRERASRRAQPTLILLHDPERGIVHQAPTPLSVGRHTVGRDVAAGEGIALQDARASRTHATLHVASRSMRVRVTDEDSRNGTALNGVAVAQEWLEDGDVLRFADSHFLFRLIAHDEDAEVSSLVGRAPPICVLRAVIARVAPHDVTVLITGASGTGKEVAARAIHELSPRKGPFVAVNCAAIPEQLAESQLFGHVVGAFTGAQRDHEGFFRAADKGTLLLDEVGDLPPALQPKLLRALEERTVVPVGSIRPVPFDARVIAATHIDLSGAIADGNFRGDLYARLSEFALFVPPLCERREDILLLFERAYGSELPPLAPDLVSALLQHDWPYNVRELRAVARELAVRGGESGVLHGDMVAHRLSTSATEVSDVPAPLRSDDPEPSGSTGAGAARGGPPARDELERIMRKHKGNVRAIARETGRSRMQVYRWCEQHGLDLNDYRTDSS